MQKRNLYFLKITSLALIMLLGVTAFADEDEISEGDKQEVKSSTKFTFTNWDDEEMQKRAWMTYGVSDWSLERINFNDSGSFNYVYKREDEYFWKFDWSSGKAEDRNFLKVRNILVKASNDGISTYYPAAEYTALMISMKDKMADSFTDPLNLFTEKWVTEVFNTTPEELQAFMLGDVSDKGLSQSEFYTALFKRYAECESAYLKICNEPPDLYIVNNILGTVIQGVIYGPDYSSSTLTYSSDDAQAYYDLHKTESVISDYFVDCFPNFAESVMQKYYHAVKAVD